MEGWSNSRGGLICRPDGVVTGVVSYGSMSYGSMLFFVSGDPGMVVISLEGRGEIDIPSYCFRILKHVNSIIKNMPPNMTVATTTIMVEAALHISSVDRLCMICRVLSS